MLISLCFINRHLSIEDTSSQTVNFVKDRVTKKKHNFAQLYIYSNKKETSDFHGTVSFDPAKMLQQK